MVGGNLNCFVLDTGQVGKSIWGICHAYLGNKLIYVERFFFLDDDEVSTI